jgi:hypothetical protein
LARFRQRPREVRIKLLAYYLRHLDRVQREFSLDNVTLEKLEEMKVVKDFEERQARKLPTCALSVSPIQENSALIDLWHSLRNMPAYLAQFHGLSGVPLSYLVREREQPDPTVQYEDVYEEMVARAPLTGFYFKRDNEALWIFLSMKYNSLLPACTWRQFEATNDGRGAYQALKQSKHW